MKRCCGVLLGKRLTDGERQSTTQARDTDAGEDVRLLDGAAIVTAAAVTVMLLMVQTAHGDMVYLVHSGRSGRHAGDAATRRSRHVLD